MEHLLNLIDYGLAVVIDMEVVHPDCAGVTIIKRGLDDESFVIQTNHAEFTCTCESAEERFREHLLPTAGWAITPYTRRTLQEAGTRMLNAWKELGAEF